MDLSVLLQTAARLQAEELRLIPGRKPVIIAATGARELDTEELPADIGPLVRPTLTADATRQLATGAAESRCRVADVGVVRVSVEARDGVTSATFYFHTDDSIPPALRSAPLSSLPPTLEPDHQPVLELDDPRSVPAATVAAGASTEPVPPDDRPSAATASSPAAAAPPAPPPVAIRSAEAAPARAPAAEASTARQVAAPTAPDTREIDALLAATLDVGASDLHLSSGAPPIVRKDGSIAALPKRAVLSAAEVQRLVAPIVPVRNRDEFNQRHDTDFAYELPGRCRFRCNLFVDRKGMGAVFRTIPKEIPTADQLGLPKAILELCRLPKGLVLVTGPTGSGKSTTLAAMIDHINRTRLSHVITIEDPIEFVFENRKCLINQRQVGEHTASFRDALRAALREDPDIVLVGELRDLETMKIAIETAETGHLVFGTLHTTSAPSTIDRIIDQFPSEQQGQVRLMLSESLKGVISQMLCKRKRGGRVAALEVLLGVPAVANLIRESKVFQIPSIMQTGRRIGMRTLNDSLLELVKSDLITPDEALSKTIDRASLTAALKEAGVEVTS